MEAEGGVDVLEAICGLVGQELIGEIDGDGSAETFEAFDHHFAVHGGDDRHDLFNSAGIQHGPLLHAFCARQIKTSNSDPLRAGSGGLMISFNRGAGGAIFSHGSTLQGG